MQVADLTETWSAPEAPGNCRRRALDVDFGCTASGRVRVIPLIKKTLAYVKRRAGAHAQVEDKMFESR